MTKEILTVMMKVKKQLRSRLERFLREWPRTEEFGGFLLKSNRTDCINDFIPITNLSDNPSKQYDIKDRVRAKNLAKKIAGSRGYRVWAFWHSHPDPCIMSAADLSYSSVYDDLIFVTISPLEKYGFNRPFIWYACKGVNPVEIKFVK